MKAKIAIRFYLIAMTAVIAVLLPNEVLAASESLATYESPANLVARFMRFADGWLLPNTFADTGWDMFWRTTATVFSTALTMTWILYLNVRSDEKKSGSGSWLGWIGKATLAGMIILFLVYWIFGFIVGKYNGMTTGYTDGWFSADFKASVATLFIWAIIVGALVLIGGLIWKAVKLIPGIAGKIWKFVMGAGDVASMGWRALGALSLSGLVVNNAYWNSMESVPWPYFWTSLSSVSGLGVIVYGVGFSKAGSAFFLRILKKERMDGSCICQRQTPVYLNGQVVKDAKKTDGIARSTCGGNIPLEMMDREGRVIESAHTPSCNRCRLPKEQKCPNCEATVTHRDRKCPNCVIALVSTPDNMGSMHVPHMQAGTPIAVPAGVVGMTEGSVSQKVRVADSTVECESCHGERPIFGECPTCELIPSYFD